MNSKLLAISAVAAMIPAVASSQTAVEALEFSQTDLKGTARFMSMGGAFGALGADLSSLSQNPAGIGVYRRNDIGFSLDLDCQHSVSNAQGLRTTDNMTKFLLNNIGGVFTLRLNNSTMPNINVGFTYNKTASFNRRYAGGFSELGNSMSNYIAAITNNGFNGSNNARPWTENDLNHTSTFDPYFPNDGYDGAPWLSILGYESFLIYPSYSSDDTDRKNPYWLGQYGQGTTGTGNFWTHEYGSIDSYNIALGGNFANVVFWGMDFDIINFNYNRDTYWGENLKNAYVELGDAGLQPTNSQWSLSNSYSASGSGFNYKLGVIVKPIQELRIGFAFHTPTWYNLTETYGARTQFRYNGVQDWSKKATNGGTPATTDFNFRSPWRLIASAAAVLGGRFIISADYEWAGYNGMKYSTPTYSYAGDYDWGWDNGDWGWGDWSWGYPMPAKQDAVTRADINYNNNPYYYSNENIKTMTQSTNTVRIGAEFRVTDDFSVRAGYSFVSSPVKSSVRDGKEIVYTSDVNPSYRLDNTTNYVTAGFGWSHSHFYADLAYVYKHQDSTFHAFTPDPYASVGRQSPSASLSLDNHQVILSMGVKF